MQSIVHLAEYDQEHLRDMFWSELCLQPRSPLQPEGDDVRLQGWVKPGSWWSDPSPHTCWCHLLQNPHLDAEVWNARTLWNNWKTLEVQIMTAEVALNSRQPRNLYQKIGSLNRVAKCHIFYTGNKDCHEFRFSIVRIVISVSNITSPRIVFVAVVVSQKSEIFQKI